MNIGLQRTKLTSRAQFLVDQDMEIISAFSDESCQRRHWEILGLARVPCRGKHLKRPGEVASIDFKRKNIGKGRKRIEVYVVSKQPAPNPD